MSSSTSVRHRSGPEAAPDLFRAVRCEPPGLTLRRPYPHMIRLYHWDCSLPSWPVRKRHQPRRVVKVTSTVSAVVSAGPWSSTGASGIRGCECPGLCGNRAVDISHVECAGPCVEAGSRAIWSRECSRGRWARLARRPGSVSQSSTS